MTSTPVTPVRAAPSFTAPRWQRTTGLIRSWLPKLGWAIVSVGLFTAIWELCWYFGWADPRLLPPPPVFLSDLTGQAKFFNTAQRWQIGVDASAGPSPVMAVLITILSSTMRVFAGLGLATAISISLGVAIRYFRLVEHLPCRPSPCLLQSPPWHGCRSPSSSSGSATGQRSLWCLSRCSFT